MELLLTQGALIESQDTCNRTPLHVAAQWGRTDLVKLLLAKGALVDST